MRKRKPKPKRQWGAENILAAILAVRSLLRLRAMTLWLQTDQSVLRTEKSERGQNKAEKGVTTHWSSSFRASLCVVSHKMSNRRTASTVDAHSAAPPAHSILERAATVQFEASTITVHSIYFALLAIMFPVGGVSVHTHLWHYWNQLSYMKARTSEVSVWSTGHQAYHSTFLPHQMLNSQSPLKCEPLRRLTMWGDMSICIPF